MSRLRQEDLIPVTRVPKGLPQSSRGGRIHTSTVRRWIRRGLQGIRLESMLIGGKRYTSRQAIDRVFERVNAAQFRPDQPVLPDRDRLAAVDDELDTRLGPSRDRRDR